jgi:hypothetical protein
MDGRIIPMFSESPSLGHCETGDSPPTAGDGYLPEQMYTLLSRFPLFLAWV